MDPSWVIEPTTLLLDGAIKLMTNQTVHGLFHVSGTRGCSGVVNQESEK